MVKKNTEKSFFISDDAVGSDCHRIPFLYKLLNFSEFFLKKIGPDCRINKKILEKISKKFDFIHPQRRIWNLCKRKNGNSIRTTHFTRRLDEIWTRHNFCIKNRGRCLLFRFLCLMPTLKVIHICNSLQPPHKPKIAKEYAFANASN